MISCHLSKFRRINSASISSAFQLYSTKENVNNSFSLIPRKPKLLKTHFHNPKVATIVECAVKELKLRPEDILMALKESPDLEGTSPEQWRTCFNHLTQYGFIPNGILKMIVQYPGLLKFEEAELEESIHNWMGCMFGEAQLLPLLVDNPYFLNIDIETLNYRIPRFLDYLEGKRKRVLMLLINSPQVMFKNWEQIEDIMNYMTEPMRIPKSQIYRSGVFRYDLFHLRVRFLFLYRAGVYIIRHYKADPLDPPKHPPLTDIVDSSDEKFAHRVAKLSMPEFVMFKELMYIQEVEGNPTDDETEVTYGLVNKYLSCDDRNPSVRKQVRRPKPQPPVVE